MTRLGSFSSRISFNSLFSEGDCSGLNDTNMFVLTRYELVLTGGSVLGFLTPCHVDSTTAQFRSVLTLSPRPSSFYAVASRFLLFINSWPSCPRCSDI